MAYDEELAERIRAVVGGESGIDERRMFGGLAFLVHDHMAVAVTGQGGMMVRVDRDAGEQLTDGVDVVPMEMRGRPMRGWLLVADGAIATDAELRTWTERGVAYARTLPPKG